MNRMKQSSRWCVLFLSLSLTSEAAVGASASQFGDRGVFDGVIPSASPRFTANDDGAHLEGIPGLGQRRAWEQLEIPGATCGDGSPYSVFVSAGDPDKLVLSFMGGGACWDEATCYGPLRLTWLGGVSNPRDRMGGIYSADRGKSAAADYTMVHFPYCTGDVHLGRHEAQYGGKKTFHVGASNVEKALAQLIETHVVDPLRVSDLAVYGYSAGAIGALYHVDGINRLFPFTARKTLLSDAPGLHFGPRFWKKFTPALRRDYAKAMKVIGYDLNPESGLMGDLVSKVCARFPDWQIGVLQGTHDIVMSAVFGDITPWEHARQVFGPGGLWNAGRAEGDNCMVWIPTTPMHTFLVVDFSAEIEAEGASAWLFTRDRLSQRGDRSYRD
mgnify:CR=1 FL=1